ncbi:MAG: hypothetical protein WBE72_12990 [Terracidiphilus sp.]
MIRLPRIAPWIALAFAAALGAAVCHRRLVLAVPTVSAAVTAAQAPDAQAPDAQDQGPDPAAVNQAPAGPSYTTEAPPPPDQSAAPGQPPDDSDYGEQPTQTATEAPPPLPDYDQPPPPSDGYIWTPGYWAWGPAGYYWVPGAWVEPPYMGALWTPGYWGFYGGRYLFYPGRWGLHIGFYGGINYGFGYIGLGYEGGYWNGGHFFYNRVYNRLGARVVHAYSYNAGNRIVNGARYSFHGGAGVQVRPRPSEAAAWHEPYAPRMSTQVQHAQSYAQVRGQFAAQNHGKPATPAISRPIRADRNVRPTMPNQSHGGQRH